MTRIEHSTRRLLCVLVLTLALAPALQAATVTGVVVNGLTGQPVRGATVTVEGQDVEGISDLNGLLTLQLPAGTYSVTVRMEDFTSQRVDDVVVTNGGGNFAVVLEPAAGSDTTGQTVTDEITITAEADLATETALLAERKSAPQISDSIGAEEMSKNSGGDAAGVLKRVTGISLEDGKFAYVRGLGDRYSNTQLNGSKLPSTEFEKKVVPLDLFPADLIQKITVSKSYTVDKPGDFAAGFIELSTVDLPPQQSMSIGLSAGWNSLTTGEDYLEYAGGLGFSGSGGQSLPSAVPGEPLVPFSIFSGVGFTGEELEAFGESLVGTWWPTQETGAPLNQSFDIAYGNSFGKFGFVLSAAYENGFQNREEDRTVFRLANDGNGVVPNNVYGFDFTNENVRQAITGNLAYHPSPNHHVRLRSLLTNLADAESRYQLGFFSDEGSLVEDYRVSYREQEVLNLQASGDHFFSEAGSAGSLFEWRASSSEATTAENKRETLYQDINGTFLLTDNAQSGFMYFNDLEDTLDEARLDWSTYFNKGENFGSIKGGFAFLQNDRQFFGRRLRYAHRNTTGVDLRLPAEQLFIPENLTDNITRTPFLVQEITRPTDAYNGDHEVQAAYLQLDYAWGKWRFIGGVRAEDSNMEVVTFNPNVPDAPPIVSVVDDTDILPSLSLVYQVRSDTNLRFSASRTVNRPQYRELAPFKFANVVGSYASAGNPDLQRALITSFDARWEWFPSSGEVIAASVFYKDFEDPIEGILLTGAELVETFDNVQGAENIGVELEVRKNLATFSDSLKGFTVIANYAYIDSEISIDPATTVLTNTSRPLEGQPESIFNFIFEWNRPQSGTVVRLLYNQTGDKIHAGGAFGIPDVIEEARDTLDIVYGQDLGNWARGLSFKISGKNLLDTEKEWTQGDGIFRYYEPGRGISLGLSFKPFAR